MTRKEAAEIILNFIRKQGFKPHDIEYGDGYFICYMGDDSVCQFKVKGLPGWIFRMWIATDEEKLKQDGEEEYPVVQFFCRHKSDLNKFRPSRSYFRIKYTYQELCNIEKDDWDLYEIKDILTMIKRHPIIAYQMSYDQGQYCDKSYICYYLSGRFEGIKYNLKDWWKDFSTKMWHGSKVWFIKQYKVVDKAELKDMNHDGWESSPRYEMRIHFKKLYDDEDRQEKAEIKMLDIWLRKNYYSNMHLILTRDGVDGIYHYQMKEKS